MNGLPNIQIGNQINGLSRVRASRITSNDGIFTNLSAGQLTLSALVIDNVRPNEIMLTDSLLQVDTLANPSTGLFLYNDGTHGTNSIYYKYVEGGNLAPNFSIATMSVTNLFVENENIGNLNVSAVSITNLYVQGNISCTGNFYINSTIVTVTDQFMISNTGTGPALTVIQTGANDIATFYDDATPMMRLLDGGLTSCTSLQADSLTAGSVAIINRLSVPNLFASSISVSGQISTASLYVQNLSVSSQISAAAIQAGNVSVTGTLRVNGSTFLGTQWQALDTNLSILTHAFRYDGGDGNIQYYNDYDCRQISTIIVARLANHSTVSYTVIMQSNQIGHVIIRNQLSTPAIYSPSVSVSGQLSAAAIHVPAVSVSSQLSAAAIYTQALSAAAIYAPAVSVSTQISAAAIYTQALSAAAIYAPAVSVSSQLSAAAVYTQTLSAASIYAPAVSVSTQLSAATIFTPLISVTTRLSAAAIFTTSLQVANISVSSSLSVSSLYALYAGFGMAPNSTYNIAAAGKSSFSTNSSYIRSEATTLNTSYAVANTVGTNVDITDTNRMAQFCNSENGTTGRYVATTYHLTGTASTNRCIGDLIFYRVGGTLGSWLFRGRNASTGGYYFHDVCELNANQCYLNPSIANVTICGSEPPLSGWNVAIGRSTPNDNGNTMINGNLWVRGAVTEKILISNTTISIATISAGEISKLSVLSANIVSLSASTVSATTIYNNNFYSSVTTSGNIYDRCGGTANETKRGAFSHYTLTNAASYLRIYVTEGTTAFTSGAPVVMHVNIGIGCTYGSSPSWSFGTRAIDFRISLYPWLNPYSGIWSAYYQATSSTPNTTDDGSGPFTSSPGYGTATTGTSGGYRYVSFSINLGFASSYTYLVRASAEVTSEINTIGLIDIQNTSS